MKKFNIGFLGIIGILVLVVFASGCVSSGNNTTMNNSSSSNGQSTQSTSSSGTATVKVITNGPWTGNIEDSSGSKSVQGTGSQTFQLAQNPGIVSVTFQKDNSKDAVSTNGTITPDTSTLTVQIVNGSGNVVATQTTSANAGAVAVSHNF